MFQCKQYVSQYAGLVFQQLMSMVSNGGLGDFLFPLPCESSVPPRREVVFFCIWGAGRFTRVRLVLPLLQCSSVCGCENPPPHLKLIFLPSPMFVFLSYASMLRPFRSHWLPDCRLSSISNHLFFFFYPFFSPTFFPPPVLSLGCAPSLWPAGTGRSCDLGLLGLSPLASVCGSAHPAVLLLYRSSYSPSTPAPAPSPV